MTDCSSDRSRADFSVVLWLFVWLVVGSSLWAGAVVGGWGGYAAAFAEAAR